MNHLKILIITISFLTLCFEDLFERQSYKEIGRKGDRERENLLCSGSISKWMQWPGLSYGKLEARSIIQVSNVDAEAQGLVPSSTVSQAGAAVAGTGIHKDTGLISSSLTAVPQHPAPHDHFLKGLLWARECLLTFI